MGEKKTIAPASETTALMNAIAKRWSFAEAMYWLTVAIADEFPSGLLLPLEALSRNYAEWGLQADGTVDRTAPGVSACPTSSAVQSAIPDFSTTTHRPLLVWMRAQIAGGVPLRRQVLTAFAEWRVGFSRDSFALMQNDASIGAPSGAKSSSAVRLAGCSLDEFLFAPNDGGHPHLDSQWKLSLFTFPHTTKPRTLEERCGKKLMQALGTVFLSITENCPAELAGSLGKKLQRSDPPYFATKAPLRKIVVALKDHFPELNDYREANLIRALPRFVASPLGRPIGSTKTGRATKRPAATRRIATSTKRTR